MKSRFTRSADGTPVAYDGSGDGPAVILLHGGGTSRQDWHEANYVSRLKKDYMVITMDLRGHGESGLPTDPAAYTVEKWCQDILAVAEACNVDRFALWAMSFGGKVGRYLATQSDRVAALVLMGTPLGPGVVGEQRQMAVDFLDHWSPIVRAQQEGTLDLETLSAADRDALSRLNVPAMLGWVQAMLDWPTVEPANFLCRTLWLIGTEDDHAMASFRHYEASIAGSKLLVQLMDGLDHDQVFDEIDIVFPVMLAFTQQWATKPADS